MNATLPHKRLDALHVYQTAVNSSSPVLAASEPEGFYDTVFDKAYAALWISLKPTSPSRFTPKLVSALRQGQQEIENRLRREVASGRADRVRYQIFGSRIPGVFSLGGDLEFFAGAVRNQDREALTAYALECVELIYSSAVGYGLPITTISLVQGDALGGGFEAALAANVVVAERQCKMGFPEVLLNMFPGMGAYQLLTRRLTPRQAERLILGGRIYDAEELYEMGLIDILAEEHRGEEAVHDYLRRSHRQSHAAWGLRRAIQAISAIRYEDLLGMVEVWVDTVLALEERDLKRMDYMIRAHGQEGDVRR